MNAIAKWSTRLILLLFLALVAAGIKIYGNRLNNSPDQPSDGYVLDSFVMGTVLNVKVRGVEQPAAELAAEAATEEVRRINRIFDPHDLESEISRINALAGPGGRVAVSRDMAVVAGAAVRIRDASGRSFDPALGQLIDLWAFSDENTRTEPPDSALLAALADSLSTDGLLQYIENGDSLVLPPGSGRIDMGGIAKGYAVDRAIAVLDSLGIENALVNLGGEISVLGVGSNGTSWRVGIQHPRLSGNHLGVINQVEGWAVATSGDYERFFEYRGRRYHHILDPSTGFSADNGHAVSVTIIASSGLDADALATAAFVLGPEAGIRFVEEYGAQGLIVFRTGPAGEGPGLDYLTTPGFLQIMKPDLGGKPIM